MGRWTQRQGRRLLGGTAIAAVLCTLSAITGLGLGASSAADGDADALMAAINSSRSSLAGVGALAARGDMAEVATRHAARMAERGAIFHNGALGTDVSGWEVVGENVGVGPDVDTLHQAFLDSPAHRANVLDGRFTEVGIGVVRSGGHLWVVEVFRKPVAAPAAAPAPAPAPAATPAPAPAPATAPAPIDAAAPAAPPAARPSRAITPPVVEAAPAPAPVAAVADEAPPAPPVPELPAALVESTPTAAELADQTAVRWGAGQTASTAPTAGATSASSGAALPHPATLAVGLWLVVATLLVGQLRHGGIARTTSAARRPGLSTATVG